MFRKLLVCVLLLSCPARVRGQHIISTVAGGGPNNIPALQAGVGLPSSVFMDSLGNLYIADGFSTVYKVDGSGILTRVAGNGGPGFSGDGGSATDSHLSEPRGVCADRAGNIYIADSLNNRIREVVAATGNIRTVAGNGTAGSTGDGGPATSAELDDPTGVSVDGAGNIFIADSTNNRIREVVAATGNIRTVAGNGTAGSTGDGGPAASAELNTPLGVFVDGFGNIFIADSTNNRIREVVAATGNIQTVAGTGTAGFSGDGGPATSAEMTNPGSVFVDGKGNIFIADSGNSRIREVVAATGTIQTVAGSGTASFGGDGGPATSASLFAVGVFVDVSGNIFIADEGNSRIREVLATTGNIQTVAGNGTVSFSGDGGPATSAQLAEPLGLFVDGNDNIFIVDLLNIRVRKVVAATGAIQTVAGNGLSGSGGPATGNTLSVPVGVFVDGSGNIFISDLGLEAIREVVAATGTIQTVAGNGTAGFAGDGGPAISAELNNPIGVFVDASGNIFIADSQNHRVRKVVAATGTIQTVAGNGTAGFSGEGGPATSAELNTPTGVFVDPAGNIFIADTFNFRVREVVAATGNIQTVAGNGTAGSSGDGGPATAAQLVPTGIFVDRTGNLFALDPADNRVREVVAATGNIQTVVGNGTFGFGGDGGPATSAEIAPITGFLSAVWGDQNGNLYLSDSGNGRIRKVTGLVAGPPANITATGGTSQSAAVSTAFPSPLAATVTDAFGNAVAGVTVTFTAPTSGATGTFVDGVSSTTATTNTAGVATSPVFTANGTLGSYMVTATAAGVAGSAAFNLTNASTLAIATTTLPPATVGVAYSSTLQATGGLAPYSWSVSSGTLPAGLTLNSSSGAITGTPTSGGTVTFTVKVTDSETPPASQSAGLSVTVATGNPSTLIVLPKPATVAYGTGICFYAQDANGNSIAATWSISPSTGAGTITPTSSPQCPASTQSGSSLPGALYQAPASTPSGSTSQTVKVTAAPSSGGCSNSATNCSWSFTLTGTNGLTACCSLPLSLTAAVGTTSNATGVQLAGVPATSTVPFTLSCSTIGSDGSTQPMPVGSGCIFTLPPAKGGGQLLSPNTISGPSQVAACYVFTTGPNATTGMANPAGRTLPNSPTSHLYVLGTLTIGILALLASFVMSRHSLVQRRYLYAVTILGLACISVSLLGACGTGYSPNSVTSVPAHVTPAGNYQVRILATPPAGSGFVQTQLIVPLTLN